MKRPAARNRFTTGGIQKAAGGFLFSAGGRGPATGGKRVSRGGKRSSRGGEAVSEGGEQNATGGKPVSAGGNLISRGGIRSATGAKQFAVGGLGFPEGGRGIGGAGGSGKLEPAVGIEPTTRSLQNCCSTTELSWHRVALAERKTPWKLLSRRKSARQAVSLRQGRIGPEFNRIAVQIPRADRFRRPTRSPEALSFADDGRDGLVCITFAN
jgi:hypothetical protein